MNKNPNQEPVYNKKTLESTNIYKQMVGFLVIALVIAVLYITGMLVYTAYKQPDNRITISDVFVDVDADGDFDYVVEADVLLNNRTVLDFLPSPQPNQP